MDNSNADAQKKQQQDVPDPLNQAASQSDDDDDDDDYYGKCGVYCPPGIACRCSRFGFSFRRHGTRIDGRAKLRPVLSRLAGCAWTGRKPHAARSAGERWDDGRPATRQCNTNEPAAGSSPTTGSGGHAAASTNDGSHHLAAERGREFRTRPSRTDCNPRFVFSSFLSNYMCATE